MADATGTVREEFEGKTYELRLTMRGIGTLQAEYGNNIAGLLDGTSGEIPNFGALLDLVSVALQKGGGIDGTEADTLADEMLTSNPGLVERIIKAAFPDTVGNVKKPKKAAT